MIKCIMTPRAAAVAFAASALFAAPALADPVTQHKPAKGGKAASVQFNFGNGVELSYASGDWALNHYHGYYGNRGYRNRDYNQRYRQQRLRKDAIQACRRAVKYEARNRGFRRAYFEGVERVRQIGPRGFLVRAEFEFEGRRRDFDRDVTCEVRRGRVVDINNLPRPRVNRNGGYGYNYNHPRSNDHGYHNNDHLRGGKSKKKAY